MISCGGGGAERDTSVPELRGATWLHEGEYFDSPWDQKGHLLEPSEAARSHRELGQGARRSCLAGPERSRQVHF